MADRFWVGGTGNWSDNTNHWSASSGGAPNASLPTSADDVFFDANSFSAGSQVVTVDATAYCLDMDWTGATNTPTLSGAGQSLVIGGGLTTISAMVWNGGTVTFYDAGSHSITTNGLTIAGTDLWYFSNTGTYTLQDSLTMTTGFALGQGVVNTNNQAITITSFTLYGGGVKTLTLGSSNVVCTSWDYSGSNLTLTANTATINCSGNFSGGGLSTYYNVNLTGATSTWTGDNSINVLGFTRADVQTLTFTGTTQTVQNIVRDYGTSVKTIVNGTFTKVLGGKVDLDYMSISGSTATANKFYAGANSTNGGSNTGWIFTERPKFSIDPTASEKVAIRPYPWVDPNGLVLWLPGVPGNGAAIYDKSGQGNDGVITDATWANKDRFWGLDFNGASAVVTVTDSGGILATSTMSMLTWFKSAQTDPFDGSPCLMGKKNTTYDQANGWLWFLGAGNIIWLRGASGTGQSSSTLTLAQDVWYFMAVTVTGTTVAFYQNAASIGGGTGTITAISSNTDDLRVGKMSNDYPSWLDGVTKFSRVYNRVLTATEIADSFARERGIFGV